jgi:predicted phosphodiesterase
VDDVPGVQRTLLEWRKMPFAWLIYLVAPLHDRYSRSASVPMINFLRCCLASLAGALLLGVASLLHAAPPPPIDGGFSLVVIPDSQHYTWKRPDLYELQTRWIASNAAPYHIVRLLHVGDITQHNTVNEWQAARRAHALISGRVPAIYAQGNHDISDRGGAPDSRASHFSEYVTLADYRAQPGFGGVYDREPDNTANSYHTFEAGGRKWLVLSLEFAPRNDVLRWANEVLAKSPEFTVILLTHAYLRGDVTRYDRNVLTPNSKRPNKGFDQYSLSKNPEGYNDGEDLWKKLVSRHANFALVICGHTCTSAHLVSIGEHGNRVHQILVDYQDCEPFGGGAWLRLLQFLPDGKTVRVRDYSPLLDKTSKDAACAFEFELDPLRHPSN